MVEGLRYFGGTTLENGCNQISFWLAKIFENCPAGFFKFSGNDRVGGNKKTVPYSPTNLNNNCCDAF